jgi:hypothetical protein
MTAAFGTQCLKFWYWRHVSTMNKIEVALISSGSRNVLWTSKLTFPSKTWHRASVSLQFTANQQIEIRATHLGLNITYFEFLLSISISKCHFLYTNQKPQ